MTQPTIADKKPAVIELQPGDYWWCACGLSKSQPMCDGAHRGSGMGPKKVTIEKAGKVALCNCKQSKKGAFCDGTHASL
jgi:CDGSH-type Zn-finger protein